MNLPKTRLGIAAGVVAGSAGMALLAGLGPAQNLLPIASARGADDDRAPTATVDGHGGRDADDPAAPGVPATGTQVVDAAGAGTVTVAVGGNTLDVVAATPAAGWTARVEVASGREVEVDFRRGTQRVQVDLEIEDGMVRQRLRIRDSADGTDIRIVNGRIVEAKGPGAADDDRGPSANAGPGNANDDQGVDSSGPGSADDDQADKSGGGADDPAGDDHGIDDRADGNRVDTRVDDHGGHGADDPAGGDHGGDG